MVSGLDCVFSMVLEVTRDRMVDGSSCECVSCLCLVCYVAYFVFFFFQAEDGIRDRFT